MPKYIQAFSDGTYGTAGMSCTLHIWPRLMYHNTNFIGQRADSNKKKRTVIIKMQCSMQSSRYIFALIIKFCHKMVYIIIMIKGDVHVLHGVSNKGHA